jgi:hypothetical protein
MPHARMEKYISSQIKHWQQQKEMVDFEEKKRTQLPYVTISREYGCGGFEIAVKIVEIMNEDKSLKPVWAAYDKRLLDKLMKDMGLSTSLLETLTNNARNQFTNLLQTSFTKFPSQVAVYRKLVETIRLLALNGNVVIVGRAGNVITREINHGYNVRLVAPNEWKIDQLKTKYGITRKEAETRIRDKNMQREGFLRDFVKFDPADPHNYDVVINCARFSTEETARLIIEGMKIKGHQTA